MDPTYLCVRFFVVLYVKVLLLQLLPLRIFAVLRMIGDPNLCVSLVRIELCSQWEGFGVEYVWWFFVSFFFLSLEPQ